MENKMKKATRCLYCEAPEDFIIKCEEGIYFCKKCDRFYSTEEIEIECSDCNSLDSLTAEEKRLIDKEIFECRECKKQYGKKDIKKLVKKRK